MHNKDMDTYNAVSICLSLITQISYLLQWWRGEVMGVELPRYRHVYGFGRGGL